MTPEEACARIEVDGTMAQEEFWVLSYDVAMCRDVLNRAEARYREFAEAHPGESFRVFRPEDIERASSDEVKPLWP